LQFKLGYLALRRDELDALQREIFGQLMEAPGGKEAQMLKTEVAQDLYWRVMNTNPSRNPGRALPVDSVSWLEAQEFCQRLSWLLGTRVRLPTEAEARAGFAAVSDAWSADTSGGHSHEAGKSAATPAGFRDLAGNLAEWLQPAADPSESAPVAGGSYLDPANTLTAFTVTPVEKHERARHIGFRVVVETAPR
jgi:formylglycine-generating enzyme required for sulfatase activity